MADDATDREPLVASDPFQPFDATHPVAFVADHVSIAGCPAATMIGATLRLTVTGGAPVPLSATAVGLVDALEDTSRLAVAAPVAVGLNVTEILQVPFGATVEHVDVDAKADAFVPVIPTPFTESAALPVLVTVTVSAELVVPVA